MSDTFDINNRQTWDWVSTNPEDFPAEIGDHRLNPEDPGSFYQMENGVPRRHNCPADLVFNPKLNACDYPADCTEEDVYNWAVSKGLVNDQR